MKNMPALFFLTAGLFALVGMGWGIQMSATQDHLLSPAHGHLNLIGFVVMSVYGAFYALFPAAAASRICVLHYSVTVLAVVIMVPGIAMAITGNGEALAKLGSVLAILSMATFVYVAARQGMSGSRAPAVSEQA